MVLRTIVEIEIIQWPPTEVIWLNKIVTRVIVDDILAITVNNNDIWLIY